MNLQTLQLIAGTVSTVIFMSSTFPMLFKALKTHDLQSYSLSALVLNTVGNLIHWLYVASLPPGPVWFLHGFATVSTLLMLIWYLMYRCYAGCRS